MGTNHLGHYALTGRLLPLLLKSDHPRVVNVASIVHMRAALDVDDLQAEKSYVPEYVYANTKMANLLFTRQLVKLSQESKKAKKLVVVAAHPGVSATNLTTHMYWYEKLFTSLIQPLLVQGADK